MPAHETTTDPVGQWVICDYLKDVAPDDGGVVHELKLLSIGPTDYTATNRSAQSGWGTAWNLLINRPRRLALKAKEDQSGLLTLDDGIEYRFLSLLCLDRSGEPTGVLSWYGSVEQEVPRPPRHGAFRLHLDKGSGEVLSTGETHWTAETLAYSKMTSEQLVAEGSETEYWLEHMVHPDDRAELDWKIKSGALAANGRRQMIGFRSTSRTGPDRRYEQCGLTAYGKPVPGDENVVLIRGLWRQLSAPSITLVTGLNVVDDAMAAQSAISAVSDFLAFAWVDATTFTVLRTSAGWAAFGLPDVEGRDIRAMAGNDTQAITSLTESSRTSGGSVGVVVHLPNAGLFRLYPATVSGGPTGSVVVIAFRKEPNGTA